MAFVLTQSFILMLSIVICEALNLFQSNLAQVDSMVGRGIGIFFLIKKVTVGSVLLMLGSDQSYIIDLLLIVMQTNHH